MNLKDRLITTALIIPAVALTLSAGINSYKKIVNILETKKAIEQERIKQSQYQEIIKKELDKKYRIISQDELDRYILGSDYLAPTNFPITEDYFNKTNQTPALENNYPTNKPTINYPKTTRRDIWC